MDDLDSKPAQQLLLEQWKLLSELVRHEDDLSWQKFGYGVAINGALVGAWTVSPVILNAGIWAQIFFVVLGVIVCGLWHLMQARVRAYQDLRSNQAKEVETELERLAQHPFRVYRQGVPKGRLAYSFGAQTLLTWIPVACLLLWVGFGLRLLFVYFTTT